MLDLPEALLEERCPLAKTGRPHLEVASPAAEQRGPGIESTAHLLLGACRLGLRRLAGLEPGHDRLQLGDSPALGGHDLGQFVGPGRQRLLLDEDLAALGLNSGERLRRGGEPAIVGLEALGDLGRLVPCRDHGTGRRRLAALGFDERPFSCSPARLRLGQGRGRDTAGRRRADPPQSRSEAISGWRDDDPMRSGERRAGGVREAVDTASVRQQAVEQTVDIGTCRADVRSHWLADGHRVRGPGDAAFEGDDSSVCVRSA